MLKYGTVNYSNLDTGFTPILFKSHLFWFHIKIHSHKVFPQRASHKVFSLEMFLPKNNIGDIVARIQGFWCVLVLCHWRWYRINYTEQWIFFFRKMVEIQYWNLDSTLKKMSHLCQNYVPFVDLQSLPSWNCYTQNGDWPKIELFTPKVHRGLNWNCRAT